MVQNTRIRLLASAGLKRALIPEMFDLMVLEAWLSRAPVVWTGALPLCVLVASEDTSAYRNSELSRFMAQAGVKVHELSRDISDTEIGHLVLGPLAAALIGAQADAQASRAEAAALRTDFMQLQSQFGAAEDFLYTAFAPRFVCARAWELAESKAAAEGQTYVQRLPTGSSGLVAVDIWMAGAGQAELQFRRPTGDAFSPKITLEATQAGWVRARLARALTGLAEDIEICVQTESGLGFTHPSVVKPLCASVEGTRQNAPLALRIWKGLPDVRLPALAGEPFVQARQILPPSALPEPEVQGGGTVKRLRGRDAFSLHPGHNGQLDLVFRGVEIPATANIAAYVQNFGPETVTLSMALSKDHPARHVYLQAESHGQCELDIPAPGLVDLHFKLLAPSPIASVYIRGIEICPVAE